MQAPRRGRQRPAVVLASSSGRQVQRRRPHRPLPRLRRASRSRRPPRPPGSDADSQWRALVTTLNTYHNLASAVNQSRNLYALMSSVQVPLSRPGRASSPARWRTAIALSTAMIRLTPPILKRYLPGPRHRAGSATCGEVWTAIAVPALPPHPFSVVAEIIKDT